MCVSGCPIGYYANTVSGACEVCSVSLNCAACFVDTDLSVKCTSCNYGYFYNSATKTCVTVCDQYMYKSRWNLACE